MPPPTHSGMNTISAVRRTHVEHDVAPFVAGRDVQEDQLVGPFVLIPGSHLHRIAGIAQVDEVRPLHDPPPVHVQTRNHALGKHVTKRPTET